MATFAEVRSAWNAAAVRLGVNPDNLAHRHELARTVRRWIVEAAGLPADEKAQQYRMAVWGLDDIK